MKRLISLFLVFTTSLCLVSFASANNSSPYIVTVLEDSSDNYVIKVTTDSGYEIASKDRHTYIITSNKYNLHDELISSTVFDASALLHPSAIAPADYYQHTFSNIEYDVDDTGYVYETWVCRNVDLYKTRINYPNSTVSIALANFANAVDSVNSTELSLIFSAGRTTAEVIISALISSGLGAGLALVEGSVSITGDVKDMYSAIEWAGKKFDEIPGPLD